MITKNKNHQQVTMSMETKSDNEQTNFQKSGSKTNTNYEDRFSNKNSNDQVQTKLADRRKQDDKCNFRLISIALHKIEMANTSLGVTLNENDDKDYNKLGNNTTATGWSPLWKQTLSSSAPILHTLISGLTLGYSAILLPQLKNESGPIPSDEETASWIASIAALPMTPGCLLAGWLMVKFGRRTSLYILCVPLLIGWIFIVCANNLALLLTGRFFTGFSVGILGPLAPVYIGETTAPKYRGLFLANIALAVAIGILLAHVVGTFLTWKKTAVFCGVFPILTIFLLNFVPESPTWLITQGRFDDGIKAFHWLRGYEDDANMELKGIIDRKKAIDNEPQVNWKDKLVSLKSPEFVKPLFIMILFFVTAQFSGFNAVAFYSVEIAEKAVGNSIDNYLAMIIIDLLRVVMSIIACIICKKYGRRPLCFISGFGTAISMGALSIFLYFKPENMSWLPLTCLLFYICTISVGLVPLPWIMCGEIFPIKLRGFGSGISASTTFVSFFIVVKTAPGMISNFGEMLTFLFYGIVAFIGTAIMYFVLPETKGRSLLEIEEAFRKGKSPGSQF